VSRNGCGSATLAAMAAKTPTTPRSFVALLRGINVGGNNIIPMADLREAMADMGAEDVATYIQSGNVLFEGGRDSAKAWTTRIEAALSRRFDYTATVVVLGHEQLRAVVDDAPKGFGRDAGYRFDVLFLKPPLTARAALKEIPTKDGVDVATAGPGVVYHSRLEAKATQSQLARIVGTPLYKQLTIRNWRTTTKLLAMLDARVEDAAD
jgi:uncharacterized protein (DUF1697 family)